MLASIRLALLVLGLVAASACGDDPNTQYLPIGQACSSDEQCGTTPFVCETSGHPGGYCSKGCATDGDCVHDSVCVVGHCRRKCDSPTTCRSLENYTCYPTGATSPYCDVARP